MTRYNKFEDIVQITINDKFTNIPTYEKLSVRALEVIKSSNNKPKLFVDVCSTYLTPTGKQKRTEFALHVPMSNIDWRIECKSRKTPSLIGEILHDLNFVANIPEKTYCLILTDNLMYPYLLKLIADTIKEKGIEHKVWIGTLNDFKIKLNEVA